MSSQTTTPAPAKPVITRTEVVWRGAHAFDAGPAGRTHRIDADSKEAPGPVETLLNAIATCTATDVLDIIGKRKTPVERLSLKVTAGRRPEFPRRVERLDIEFIIDGQTIELEHAERAIQLSFERYCSVASSLGADIIVFTRLVLNGAEQESVQRRIWSPQG